MFQLSENFQEEIENDVKVVTNIRKDENKIINYEHKIFARRYSDFFVDKNELEQLDSCITSQIIDNSNLSINKNKCKIKIYISEDEKKIEIEKKIIIKIRENFEQKKIIEKSNLKDLYIKSLVSALISVVCLTVIFLIPRHFITNSVITDIILEIIKIGGWMFMWQALLFISFEKSKNFEKVKLLNNLINAPINF